MKKLAIILMIVLTMTALCGTASAALYPETARVVEINYDDDIVIVETFSGFLFAFQGCEDFCVGDGVSMIMDDLNTEKIFDDEIVMVHYCGWELINWSLGE